MLFRSETGRLPLARIDDALARQERVKHRFFGRHVVRPAVPLDRIGCAEHLDLAATLASFL